MERRFVIGFDDGDEEGSLRVVAIDSSTFKQLSQAVAVQPETKSLRS